MPLKTADFCGFSLPVASPAGPTIREASKTAAPKPEERRRTRAPRELRRGRPGDIQLSLPQPASQGF
jgi:hypothetical protein